MPKSSPFPRRSRSVALASVAVGALIALAVPADGAPSPAGDPVAAKKAQAARIAEELARRRDEVSRLAEDLNLARIDAEERAAEVAVAAEELRLAEVQVGQARTVMKRRLVKAYTTGGPPTSVMSVLAGGPTEELAVRRAYVNAVAGREQADIDGMENAIEAFDARRREMAAAESAAAEVLAQVDNRRRAAEVAVAAQRATLDTVNGDLAVLVEAERARRAAQEAARARAELEARQARERAARAATTTTTTTRARPASPSPSTATAPATGTGEAPTPVVAEPSRPATEGAEAAVAEAKRQLGKPYQYGSGGPDSFDCSGLTSHAWRAGGKGLPHSSQAQMGITTRVALDDIAVGDLIFYGSPVHHVGIYAGGGQMVEASETGTPVRMASIYRRDLTGVGRVR